MIYFLHRTSKRQVTEVLSMKGSKRGPSGWEAHTNKWFLPQSSLRSVRQTDLPALWQTACRGCARCEWPWAALFQKMRSELLFLHHLAYRLTLHQRTPSSTRETQHLMKVRNITPWWKSALKKPHQTTKPTKANQPPHPKQLTSKPTETTELD